MIVCETFVIHTQILNVVKVNKQQVTDIMERCSGAGVDSGT
jgi:hypothetical protein